MSRFSHIIPVFIYLTGLGSLFLSDILVTKYLNTESISSWAEIRSLIGIASVLCLIGLDQAFIRSPESSRRLLKTLLIQIPILATLIALIAYAMGINNHLLAVIGLCIGSAGSLALFQLYRTHHQKVESQLSQQCWKYFALVIIVYSIASGQNIELTSAVALAMLLALAASAIPAVTINVSVDKNPAELRFLYRIGARFLVTSLLLSLAIYAEQLVVSALGSAENSAYYFTHATYFLFPISVINGYVAFNIGPWVRSNRMQFIDFLRMRKAPILISAIGYAMATHGIGWFAWLTFSPGKQLPDLELQLFLLCTCIMRTLYMLPAGYLGVFGLPEQHDQLIKLQTISLFFSIALFLTLFYLLSISIIHATAAASFINWLLRTISGFFMIGRIEKSWLH